jgi:hypothetical protein
VRSACCCWVGAASPPPSPTGWPTASGRRTYNREHAHARPARPRHRHARAPGARAHRPAGVRRQGGPRPQHVARRAAARGHRGDAGGGPDRRAGTGAGGAAVAPGVTTDEIDRVVHEFLVDHGAYPSTLGYKASPSRAARASTRWSATASRTPP